MTVRTHSVPLLPRCPDCHGSMVFLGRQKSAMQHDRTPSETVSRLYGPLTRFAANCGSALFTQ
jgi:hypothetical protein